MAHEDYFDAFREILESIELQNQLGGGIFELGTTFVEVPGLPIDPGELPSLELQIVDADHLRDSRVFKVSLSFAKNPDANLKDLEETPIEADADVMFSLKQAVQICDAWPAGILLFVDGMALFTNSFNKELDWSHEDHPEHYIFVATWQPDPKERPVWIGRFIVPKELVVLKEEDEDEKSG